MARTVEAVPEEVVRLRVNGLAADTWTCTPVALEALGAGRLVALGFVRARSDLLAIVDAGSVDGVHQLEAEVSPGRTAVAIAERDHRDEHGCGPRFLVDCRPDLVAPEDPLVEPRHPEPEVFHGLFRELFARSETRGGSGGHHTTALSDGERLLYLHEEVGRHNAADKAIGDALLNGAELGRLGLVTSARISGDIAAKAARAGLAWIASRSVPTTLAVEIAATARIAIIGRAASPDARVFLP